MVGDGWLVPELQTAASRLTSVREVCMYDFADERTSTAVLAVLPSQLRRLNVVVLKDGPS